VKSDEKNIENKKEPKMHALVVDDNFANRDFFVRLLQQANLEVKGAETGKQAIEVVKELGDKLVLIMLDHRLPDQSGLSVLKVIRQELPDVKVMMATMHDERSMMREAFDCGCTGFMVKPHGFMELFKRIQNVENDPSVLDNLDKLIFDQHGPREWRG
jgi:DNA-binding response OmpR family regulator